MTQLKSATPLTPIESVNRLAAIFGSAEAQQQPEMALYIAMETDTPAPIAVEAMRQHISGEADGEGESA